MMMMIAAAAKNLLKSVSTGLHHAASPTKIANKEKVVVLDRELRKLQAECVRSGYNATQVEKFAGCFFHASSKARRERWAKTGIAVGGFLLLFFLLLQFSSPYRLTAALARAAVIKVLSVWDWTQVYHSNCLLPNPLYRDQDVLVMKDCQICEGIQSIQHVRNVNASEVVEQFFKRDVPIIVEDGLRDWDDVILQSPTAVADLYETDEVLRSEGGCGFSSNIRIKHGGHRTFLRDIVTENIPHYYAHWENCHGSAAKAFRSVYHRPYFLPPAVETSASNWVFISHNYSGSLFKQVDIDHPLVMLLQVSGQMEVQVEAWTPCDQVCSALSDTLRAGQVLIVTEFLWKASYLPVPHHDNVAIGLGASF